MQAGQVPALMISAAHKSSGKTTLTLGLAAALGSRGLCVQTFKKGPDYIDPMWLSRASGRPCFNLDPYLMTMAEMASSFSSRGADADISLLESNKGLYDGLALDGSNSNAALARQLELPVVLVIDARGMTRGIAPLLLGYRAFDPKLQIAGVILNQIGGSRHEAKLREVIEHYTDVPVLGAVHHDVKLQMPERHLGLRPTAECDDTTEQIARFVTIINAQVDVHRLLEVARSRRVSPADLPLQCPRLESPFPAGSGRVRIGIARDRAFAFYYPDDLAALEAAGAQLVPFDTLTDRGLPAVDGVFIGGGFPEMFMDELEANTVLRSDLRNAIDQGLPVYAECGGLMYLARTIRWNGRQSNMVGAIPGDAVMHARPIGRGYVHLTESANHPWPRAAGLSELRAHEFHYSILENLPPDLTYAYQMRRGHGIDGMNDGIVHRHVLASYAHQRGVGGNDWPSRFVAYVRQLRSDRTRAISFAHTDKLAA